MARRQVSFTVPTRCPKCSTTAEAHLHRNQHSGTITLEWECESCGHRWPVTRDDMTRSGEAEKPDTADHDLDFLREIATLRRENEDVRASAMRWQRLYENAIRRVAERDGELPEPRNDAQE